MTNDKKAKSQQKVTENRGCCTSEDEIESLLTKISEDTEPHSPHCKSVCNVREELKHVIETMGPNSVNDTENDDTTYSTIDHSYIQIEEIISSEKEINQTSLKQPEEEYSLMTEYNVSELVEYPTQINTSAQTSRKEYLCPNVYNNSNIPPHNFCPMSNYMTENEISTHNIARNQNLAKHSNLERVSRFATWLGMPKTKTECRNCPKTCDLYKINIEQAKEDHSPPRRLVFDLMDELPKAATKTIGTNTKQPSNPKPNSFKVYKPKDEINIKVNKSSTKIQSNGKETITERVDIYYFDHGNAEYYRTTDTAPLVKTEFIAERTDQYTKKFWAEIFGTFQIGVSFVISFILQLLRFILQSFVRPLTIGIIQLVSDYFFKPLLAVTFNGIVQPPMIFLYNFVTSVRDICAPVADSIGYFIREASVMCKAIRLVQIETEKSRKPNCNVGNSGKNSGIE